VGLANCQAAGGDQDSAATATPIAAVEEPSTPEVTLSDMPEITPLPSVQNDESPATGVELANYGYTHQRPDGNRLVAGRGSLPEATVLDIPLSGQPVWIAGAAVPNSDKTAWAVVLADGRVQAFIVDDGQVSESAIEPATVQGMPPLLKVTEDERILLVPPAPVYGAAPPAVLDEQGKLATVSPDGVVTVLDPAGMVRDSAQSQPLPDGRLLVDEQGRLLFLSQPTARYDHGIAGDGIEAGAVTLFDPESEFGNEVVITVPEPAVIEGIMPLWADLNGDGRREIIVTQSDAQAGAQIVVYDESGEQIATGPAIGLGNRWRHQLAVAPFGPQGEIELVDVLTPHIGGVVEFYQLDGDELQIVAKVPGYTSHVIGSRNLDMALAGDLDGDGRIELLVPNQGRTLLGAIRRTTADAEVVWTVPLDGKVSSNLAAVQLADDSLMVGAGREDGTLRLWLPG
jgi:hypothetical protein